MLPVEVALSLGCKDVTLSGDEDIDARRLSQLDEMRTDWIGRGFENASEG